MFLAVRAPHEVTKHIKIKISNILCELFSMILKYGYNCLMSTLYVPTYNELIFLK